MSDREPSPSTQSSIPNTPNECLLDEVRTRVESIEREVCELWGGEWKSGKARVAISSSPKYRSHTKVRSSLTARHAFKKYTDWFEYVLENHQAESDSCVLLPCGSQKPIGTSSIHQTKLEAISNSEYSDCDIIIVSEPCTVVPHDMRLCIAPVNYDFPPEYTDADVAPDVFEMFTDRLATFIDSMPYSTYYPYLIQSHQEKFDAAVEKSEASPRIVEIPGSSLNPDTMNLSGDLFKTAEDISTKLDFVHALIDERDPSLVDDYPDKVQEFYDGRSEYS